MSKQPLPDLSRYHISEQKLADYRLFWTPRAARPYHETRTLDHLKVAPGMLRISAKRYIEKALYLSRRPDEVVDHVRTALHNYQQAAVCEHLFEELMPKEEETGDGKEL